jgi:hypothetical protein
VFRDPAPLEPAPVTASPVATEAASPAAPGDETTECPSCARRVHRFNIRLDSHGRAVGCYQCGGTGAGWIGDDPLR